MSDASKVGFMYNNHEVTKIYLEVGIVTFFGQYNCFCSCMTGKLDYYVNAENTAIIL